jgi:hypothetical protein
MKNSFIHQMVNQKINTIDRKGLLSIASKYNISITPAQADQIVGVLKKERIDITNTEQRKRILKEVASVAGTETARKVNSLFLSIL